MSGSQLTAGQAAVLDRYLAAYAPTSEFDPDAVMLLSSVDIVRDLESMGDFDINAVTERMHELGYVYHIDRETPLDGWMLLHV